MMGCSNPHPHGQIWANETVPDELAREVATQQEYLQGHNATLLADYLELELRKNERVVCANEHFAALVPFWAVWPYETLLISRRAVSSLPELSDAEREGLAQILRLLTIRYDNLFKTSFPYTMGFHQRPTDDAAYPDFTFMHIFIRRCCARRPSRNSWLVMNCWRCPSETSPRSPLRNNCGNCQTCIIWTLCRANRQKD